jgi:formate dehydrogenase
MAEVYEVATFYAHFDVVADGEAKPEPVTVRVCDSLSCMLAAPRKLLTRWTARRCRACGSCARRASARATPRRQPRSGITMSTMHAAKLKQMALSGHVHPEMPPYQDYDAYVKSGGMRCCALACRANARSRT